MVDRVDRNESGASWRSYITASVLKPSAVTPNAVLIVALSLTILPIASTICSVVNKFMKIMDIEEEEEEESAMIQSAFENRLRAGLV